MTQPAPPPAPAPPATLRFPRERLVKIVEVCSGVQVTWSSMRGGLQGLRPGTAPAWIIAGVQSYRSVGVDERRMKFNAQTQTNDVVAVGQREFTLVLRAQSLSPKLQAFDLLEAVRFRMREGPARALMVPTISLADFGPIVDLGESTFDVGGGVQRQLLESTLDVFMSCIVSESPPEPGAGNWIETVAPATATPSTGPSGPIVRGDG